MLFWEIKLLFMRPVQSISQEIDTHGVIENQEEIKEWC